MPCFRGDGSARVGVTDLGRHRSTCLHGCAASDESKL